MMAEHGKEEEASNGHEEITDCKTRYLIHMQENATKHLGCYLVLIIFLSVIALRAYPVLYGDSDISDPNAQAKVALDSIRLATDEFDSIGGDGEVETSKEQITFAYEWKDGRDEDIFTAENLQSFCQVERILIEQSDYGFDICDTESSNQTCVTEKTSTGASSITAAIYRGVTSNPFFNYEDCFLLNETDLENFMTSFYAGLQANENNPLRGFVDNVVKATITRSFLEVSHPDKSVMEERLFKAEPNLIKLLNMESSFQRDAYRDEAILGNVRVYFSSATLAANNIESMIPTDFLMVAGSILFVATWMRVYTGSTFLTVSCMAYIVFSISVAMFFYKVVFGIQYFDFIHILVIFLILGIGADGVFVLIDAWKQNTEILDDEFQILQESYNRASSTVFNTSFTTMFAFAVTAITPLVPISTFGIFAALSIGVNYVFILTVVPVTVLIWSRKYYTKRKNHEGKVTDVEKAVNEQTLEEMVDETNKHFETYYYPFIMKYKRVIVAFSLVIGFLGVYGITKISQPSEAENFFPDDHMHTLFLEISKEYLAGQADEFDLVSVFHGIEGIERDFWSHYSGDRELYEDELIFENNFNPAKLEAQQAMIGLCQTLQSKTCSKDDCNGFTTLLLPPTGTYKPKCLMQDFYAFWNTTFPLEPITSNTNETLFNDRMILFVESVPGYSDSVGFIDGKVRFILNQFRLTKSRTSSGEKARVYRELMDEIMSDYESNAPSTAKYVDYGSRNFVQLSVQEALTRGVIQGLLITFPVVFFVLMFATKNWKLASISVLSIFFVVVGVLGFVFAGLGWELGIAESIVAIMVVGLAVDYTIHLGHMYKENHFTSRIDRFHFALLKMGPTVLAGGMTTLGAGIFLYGCQIIFFFKMAVLLTLTVTLSLFFSLFFLMSSVAWFGPEGEKANISIQGCKDSMERIKNRRIKPSTENSDVNNLPDLSL